MGRGEQLMGARHRGNTIVRRPNAVQRAFNRRSTPEQLAAQKTKEAPPVESWWLRYGADRVGFRAAVDARQAAKR